MTETAKVASWRPLLFKPGLVHLTAHPQIIRQGIIQINIYRLLYLLQV